MKTFTVTIRTDDTRPESLAKSLRHLAQFLAASTCGPLPDKINAVIVDNPAKDPPSLRLVDPPPRRRRQAQTQAP